MIASVPASQTMDVYNAFAKFNLGTDVGPYMSHYDNTSGSQARSEVVPLGLRH